MNNIFNIDRFARLFKKHTIEHYKIYVMSLLVLIGVMLLGGVFIIYMLNAPMEVGLQTALFTSIILLAGTIFTSMVFADLGDRKKAMAWLTLPASHFEKYLVVWLYSFVIFIVMYTISFYGVMLFLTSIKHFPGRHTELFDLFYRGGGLQVFLLYAFLHSIAFYGAVCFEKLHFVKTAFIFFIGIALLIIINHLMQQTLLGKDVMMDVPFGGARFIENKKEQSVIITVARQRDMLLLLSVLACTFWAATYYRLKEKQV